MVLLESIIDIDVSEQSPLEQPEEIIELEDEQSPLLQLESEDEDEQSPLLHPLDAADDDEPEQSPQKGDSDQGFGENHVIIKESRLTVEWKPPEDLLGPLDWQRGRMTSDTERRE
ncbi:hypothetical protein LENED_004035 [Lentinula edodes]|uniref:Uncharacterized protein n=1 Tax=Lentinula edodes TaxID=5353 RepID=A0A1Q3E571_LENED|nr:hypothetical protein LENED_004035 [Lentinula edodes]